MKGKSSSFELLHEKIQKWVWNQNWTSLKEIQENSIPIILKGDSDVIISAATAGGKTEAAFLPILSRILSEEEKTYGYSVLYISPLKALINDQYRRLINMTSDTGINITPWHGDIPLSKKNNSIKSPSGILIITPESLESFLINRYSNILPAFSELKYIVIDELHAFIGNERGKQLQSLLSRIELNIKRVVPRIAMSATFSDTEVSKLYLRQDQNLQCNIPANGNSSHEVKLIIKSYNPSEKHAIVEDIFAKLRGSNNLIFTNSRVEAEEYTIALSDMSEAKHVPNEFRIHHGNLSKIERNNVEKELQLGKTPITAVCTSTLELGVDIGKVKSIVQIGVAKSVSGLRQRLGRSGRRNEPSILRIYSIEQEKGIHHDLRTSLTKNIAVIELLRKHVYEMPQTKKLHLSTLIQQILSIIAMYGGFYPKEGWNMLCNKGAFRNISPTIFLKVLKSLGEKKVISQLNTGQIVIGKVGESILRNPDFYAAFVSPEEINVINRDNSKSIGTIAYMPKIGSFIILAGKRWIVDYVNEKYKQIYVSLANRGYEILFDFNGYEIDEIITQKMQEIYTNDTYYPYLDLKTECQQELAKARTFYKKNKLQEKSFFEYGTSSVLLTWAGEHVNRTINLICNYIINKNVENDDIAIYGILPSDIEQILKSAKPSAEDLAAKLDRTYKISQKYDSLLSDELLNIEYGSTYLNVDDAWITLTKICTQ